MSKKTAPAVLFVFTSIMSPLYAGVCAEKAVTKKFIPFAGIFYSHLWPDTIVDSINGHSDMVSNYSGVGAEVGFRYGAWFGIAGGFEHYFEKQKAVNEA